MNKSNALNDAYHPYDKRSKAQRKCGSQSAGGVAGVKVVASSGSRALDAAAIAAVRDAAPFHSFPEDLKVAMLHVEIPIVFQLKTG